MKNNIKKILALVLVALSLSACSKNKESAVKKAEKTTEKTNNPKIEKSENKTDKNKSSNKMKKEETSSTKKSDDEKKEIPLYHVIQKDQTIYAVSREYNISVNQILKLNPKLKDGKALSGQKIKLREK